MATATRSTTPDLTDNVAQVTQFNERLVAAGKQVGNLYLDGYEKVVAEVTAAEKKLAQQSPEGVQSLVDAHANLTSELARSYTAAFREVLS